MPLNTSITRNDEFVKVRWSDFHIAAMVYAVSLDSGVSPFTDIADLREQYQKLVEDEGFCPITPRDAFALANYNIIGATPLNDRPYTLREEYRFKDIMDGEELIFLPGDVLTAWRGM